MVEVNVEPDGSTTFDDAADAGAGQEEAFDTGDAGEGMGGEEGEPGFEEIVEKGIDPAIYLLVIVVIFLVGFVIYQRKKKEEEEDDFFSNLDGEKVRFVYFIDWCIVINTVGWNSERLGGMGSLTFWRCFHCYVFCKRSNLTRLFVIYYSPPIAV